MSCIHTYISSAERKQLSAKDNSYFRQKLKEHCLLNELLNKPVHRPLLAELQCLLDRKPIARRKPEQRNSKVYVYKDGVLIRIEHSNGKLMKQVR